MESSLVDRPIEDEAAGTRGRYSRRELAELSHTSSRRINAWIRAGLLAAAENDGASESFGFHQVRTANLLAKLTKNGIGTARLKRIVEQLGRRFPNPQEAVSQLELFAGLLIIRDDDRLTAPDGQLLLDLLLDGNTTPTIALRLQAADSDEVAGALFEQAVSLEQAGDLDGAARAYRECLLQSGPDAVTCFNLANVLDELGQTEAACERYRQVVELDPQYASAWNNLGLGLAQLAQHDEALEAWRRAVEVDPDSADAVFNLADALQQAKCFDEARPCWEAYLRLDGGDDRNGDDEWTSYARFCLSSATRS
jgi:tetratricopeptide (TPR) repeat protein